MLLNSTLLTLAAAVVSPPPLPIPVQVDEKGCSAPGKDQRDELLGMLGTSQIDYLKRSSAYWDAKMLARLEQLYLKAGWSNEQRQDFAAKLFGDPALGALFTQTAKNPVIDAWKRTADELQAQGVPSDERLCQVLVREINKIDLILVQQNQTKQWARIVELTDAEATKLGIALD